MRALADFTPKQAASWVAQELAKTNGLTASRRLASERSMLKLIDGPTSFDDATPMVDRFPNSTKAHAALICAIEAKYPVESRQV